LKTKQISGIRIAAGGIKIIMNSERKHCAQIAIIILLFLFFHTHVLPSSTKKKPIFNRISNNTQSDVVPLPLNKDVLKMIKFFQTERRESILKALTLMDRHLDDFRKIFREEGIPEVIAYLPFIESAYDPVAKSSAGARGIWQFMPSTARIYGLRVDSWIDERVDPEKSCRAAAKYLGYYYNKFGNWTLTIAAYNAGPTRIRRAIRRLGTRDFWKIKKSRYIRSQTKRYIPAFIAGVHIARNPYLYGFIYAKKRKTVYDIVNIHSPTDLSVVAKCVNTDIHYIRKLNPELSRSITPYKYKKYPLRIPIGTRETFLAAYAKIPESKRIIKTFYKVRRGDTLSVISRRYGVSVREIMSSNHIRSTRRLRIGQTLTIPLIPGYSNYKTRYASASPRKYKSKYTKGQKIIHKIRRGDSLYKLAGKYRTDIYSICSWNGIDARHTLYPGRKITLYYRKTLKNITQPTGKTFVYTVRRGDSLYKIARAHNTTIAMLKRANNLRKSRLFPGEKLIIPTVDNK
jgi:membrane-bound lytic murein transglycosylase D